MSQIRTKYMSIHMNVSRTLATLQVFLICFALKLVPRVPK